MVKIALAQMPIDYKRPEINIDYGMKMIDDAIKQHCNSILFPELWSTGFRLENCSNFATLNANLLVDMQSKADKSNIEIFGSFLTRYKESFYNQFKAIRPCQKPISYSKINLFPTLKEPQYLKPGSKLCVFSSNLGNCSASICFDLRFPLLYRKLLRKGAFIHIIPAHWPAARIHHWDILLQARAIETMSFVIAVNSVGKSGNTLFGGHSSVISPDGGILFQADDKSAQLFVIEFDPDEVVKVREKHPFFPSLL
jgi:predicted amidohydrolase